MEFRIAAFSIAVCVGAAFDCGFANASSLRRRHAEDPSHWRSADLSDCKTVAFTVGRANLKEDRYDTEIDLVDIASKSLRAMTHDRQGIGSVRWSADGANIAYLADDADKKSQIFIMPMAGGDSRHLTHSKTSIKLLAWKPDGTALAYAAAG